MNINRQDLDDSIINLTLTLEPTDYIKKFDQKLASTAAKATIKGFRKGKTPISVIKKMYGHAVLGDLIDELFNGELEKYIKENKLKYIAQPLIADEQEKITIDLANNKSYSLTYQLGLIPDFDVKGISASDKYEYFVPAPADDFISNELGYLAKRIGKLEDSEDIIGEELITVTASEMEGDAVKEGGFSKDVVLFMNSIEDKSLKDLLLTKKLNDTFTIEVSKLENQDLGYIKKNLFGLPDEFDLKEDDIFHYVIKKISRLIPAELTDEVIKEKFQLDGMDVLKAEILKSFTDNSRPASESLLRKAVMDRIMAETDIKISDTFVKTWLKRMEKMEDEKIDEELDKFKSELKWTYIKDEIAIENGIDVTEEDIRQSAAARIRNYEMQYGKLPEETVTNIVKNWYSNKNEIYSLGEEARTNKLFNHLFTTITKDEKVVSSEEFDKLLNPEN
jgi:trigger factor